MKKILALILLLPFLSGIFFLPGISNAATINLQLKLITLPEVEGSKFYDIQITFDEISNYDHQIINRNSTDISSQLYCSHKQDSKKYILCLDNTVQSGEVKYEVILYDQNNVELGRETKSVIIPANNSNPEENSRTEDNGSTEFGNVSTLGEYLSAVMTWLVSILSAIATLMIIYAGYLYMTSQGNPEATGKAKDILIGVITGIILLFLVEIIAVQTLGLQFTFTVTPVK